MSISQQYRTLAITTPLGPDVLLLRRMTGNEALSRLFAYNLELLSENIEIKHEELLGQPCVVRLAMQDESQRYFHGIVNHFAQAGFDGSFAIYHATLAPWIWFLTRTADCRIFQEKTVPDIIKAILSEQGFTDVRYSLSNPYRSWPYCVQYRETDFNFISRLMEQEGIYYYFEHTEDRHLLVIADSYSAHAPVIGNADIPYYPPDETALHEVEHINHWNVRAEAQPGAFAHTDFDFTAPRKDLFAKRSNPKSHDLASLEVYDYPGEYKERNDGESYARIRLEEMHANYEQIEAAGNARGLTTGALFSLRDYPREDQNKEYLVIATDYQLQSDLFGSAATAPYDDLFYCHFTAMDARTPFRPERITPKPVIQGLQTAIVVGKQGEEIWTDQYGRIKVQFHWDRYGKYDENSSCWIRVSHAWAGKEWGAIYIPRIGQEVIVEFLEGDPDRPMITGRVYNEIQRTPYELPRQATLSTLKSDSTKGSGGFNEFRYEDKKGEEQIYLHAQKDIDVRVRNESRERVYGNHHQIYGWEKDGQKGGDKREMVYKDKHITIHRNHTEHVGGDMQLLVGGIDGSGNQDVVIKANRNEKIDGNQSLTIGGGQQEKVGTNHALDAGQEIHLKAGMKVVIEAGTQLSIKVGSNFIDISATGITIQGTLVLINTTAGPAGVGSGANPTTAKDAVPTKPDVAKDGK